MRLTSFKGRLRTASGRYPVVRNEKAAAHRVKGLSQAVACRNSFCSALCMDLTFLRGQVHRQMEGLLTIVSEAVMRW
ncbi:hypothetical protein DIC66_08515 [Rhodoferax lacus]|uniref:Uncharacterized protein n=1 Tax=Rhodoferax lacus TaxID=2184758 RepID=A0A3E1RCT0_9BURK|nr:hypothetical protein DIC66_08515 [Rhodoferax lacus]